MESNQINAAIHQLKKELADIQADSNNGWEGWKNQLNRRINNQEVGSHALHALFGAMEMKVEVKKIQLQTLEIQKNIEVKKQQESKWMKS